MLYAKILLLNKNYKEADEVLTHLHIIPFEGATDGRELYREAKLMQAVQELKNKNYKKALGLTTQAREWPQNLGVGKPYDADIDLRLEDWINYLCLINTNKKIEANAMLQRVTSFKPRIDNTVRNFVPVNALITARAFDKQNKHNNSIEFLDEQIKNYPRYKTLLWSKSVFEKNNNVILSINEKDANTRIIEQLMLNENEKN